MKTAELTGAMLDYWVARAEGNEARIERHALPNPDPVRNMWCWLVVDGRVDFAFGQFNPSASWSQGGPIIEREKMHGGPAGTLDGVTTWFYQCYRKDANGEHIPYPCGGSGQTPLIAAMRAYVASKFGEEVPDAI